MNQLVEKLRENKNQGDGQQKLGRKNSLSGIIMRADNVYSREDSKKIKIEEFVSDVEFKFGFPLLILDIVGYMTGYDLIKKVKNEFEPKKPILRLNPENKLFESIKQGIPDEYYEPIQDMFNRLCDNSH
jgi:hypothetical protein